MQAIAPVDVHVEKDYRNGLVERPETKSTQRSVRPGPRMRTRVLNKTKPKKSKTSVTPSTAAIPKQVVIPKLILPVRSRSSSPDRGPWVPPPGRSTKGQKVSWQSPRSRLETTPVSEVFVDNETTPRTDRDPHSISNHSPSHSYSTSQHDHFMKDIQTYERRIQGLIDGIGMLKERVNSQANQEQTDQLRSDIDSSLLELEQLQENYARQRPAAPRSRSPSPTRPQKQQPIRSSSADESYPRRTKVSFQNDPAITQRRARSMTPIRAPLHLNPDREQLLLALADSEADVAHITKQISLVKDILTKLKFDDQTVSFEVEQLHQHRNELLYLIEQFERSNSHLKGFLRQQYHLEAEHGLTSNQYDLLMARNEVLETENRQIRRVLLDRENDNVMLQTELERIRTHTIGFDTMKSSLEQNRAHLQRELYAKEGEIHRLQCALRSLERDLHRGRHPGNRRTPTHSATHHNSSSLLPLTKPKAMTTERLPNELHDRDHLIDEMKRNTPESKTEFNDDPNSEVARLRLKLEQAERLVNEYKTQLHTETLKTSANNSRNHLSQVDFDEKRARLQKRFEELEPLPELLKQAEDKNEKLQRTIRELEKRLLDSPSDRTNDHHASDTHYQALQRKITSLEEENNKLLKALNSKDPDARRLSPINPQTQPFHVDPRNSSKSPFDQGQELSRLRLEYAQLKREKDDHERSVKSQLNELRDKLDQSNRANRSMQNYLNSLKTTYTTLFNDTLPSSGSRFTTA